MNHNSVHLAVNVVRERLLEKKQAGLLGVVAAKANVPEWMLADWCDNALNIPGRETIVLIQSALSEYVTVEPDLKSDDYQKRAFEFAVYPEKGTCSNVALLYVACKLNGEAGEVAEKIGKYHRDGGALPRDAIVRELGDVLWYIAAIASELNIPLVEVAQINLQKLEDRKARGKLHGEGDNR